MRDKILLFKHLFKFFSTVFFCRHNTVQCLIKNTNKNELNNVILAYYHESHYFSFYHFQFEKIRYYSYSKIEFNRFFILSLFK